MSFFAELKRRNVFKAAIAYIVSAWLLAQVADLVLDNFGAPDWAMQAVLIALALGFPVAMTISWVYEVTAKGVIPESQIERTITITDQSGKRLDRVIIAVLAIIIIFLGMERFLFSPAKREIEKGPVVGTLNPVGEQLPDAAESFMPADVLPASVAVLPFAVMSNGPDDDYFADGLSEEIINALSQLPDLMVTARSSAFHFKGQNLPIGDIATQLGVANLVEGSVRRAGEQLRISAQLVRAKDGFQLWSESYDRRTEDTFAVQQDIAEKVATALDILLNDDLRARMLQVGLRNVEAFIAYQKAIELTAKAHKQGVDISLLRQANVQFEAVMGLVPGFTQAYLQHADLFTHMLLSFASAQLDGNITESDIASAPQAMRRDFDRAVQLARNESERFVAAADRALLLGEWRGLDGLNQRALKAPGCKVAMWAYLTSAPFGQARAMRDAYARLAVCDPLEQRAQVSAARSYLWMGQAQQAQRVVQQALRLNDHQDLIWVEIHALMMQGNLEAAEQAVMHRPLTEVDRTYALSMLASLRGDYEQAGYYQDEYLAKHGPNELATLVMETARGNRSEADRLAAQIDRRPFGFFVLLHAITQCACGAPFALESTPGFDAMLAASGLPWPPLEPIRFPLKDW